MSFAMLLAGSNAVYPLLPVYRDMLGLDALLLSLTFSLYVGVLVVALFVLSRPRWSRFAAGLLLSSLGLMITSDLLLTHANEWSILLGRALGGLACGGGTGATSALVVAAIGSRGRAVTSTGNAAGAVLGAGGAQLLLMVFATTAPRTVFMGHAAAVAALLLGASVVLWWRRAVNQSALAVALEDTTLRPIERSAVRLFATGTIAWIGVSVAIVFGATAFDELGQPLVRAVGPVLLLATVSAAQLGSPLILRFAPWVSGVFAMTVGVTSILVGAWFRADAPAIVGFGILGAGLGVAHRAALVVLTRQAAPARQGALASLYAGITYAIAAVVVLAAGWVGRLIGVVPATVVFLGAIALAAMVALLWAPRLRETIGVDQPHRKSGQPKPVDVEQGEVLTQRIAR